MEQALERFALGTLFTAESTGIGLGGQTILLVASTGEYVLRGKPRFAGQLVKERFFVQFLHERIPTPVPWPYHYDPSPEIFGWEYALMPRLPGKRVPDVAAVPSDADRQSIAAALGRGLATLHRVVCPLPGEYDVRAGTMVPLRVPYAEWVTRRVRARVRRIVQEDAAVTRVDQEWVETLLHDAGPALREPFQPTFVMHDYNTTNVVFSEDGGSWEVCGVFDLSESYIGDGEADLARQTRGLFLIDPALAGIFLRAYLAQRPARPGFLARFPVYMLDDLLFGWTFARKQLWRDPSRSLHDLCEPLTSAAQTVLS